MLTSNPAFQKKEMLECVELVVNVFADLVYMGSYSHPALLSRAKVCLKLTELDIYSEHFFLPIISNVSIFLLHIIFVKKFKISDI